MMQENFEKFVMRIVVYAKNGGGFIYSIHNREHLNSILEVDVWPADNSQRFLIGKKLNVNGKKYTISDIQLVLSDAMTMVYPDHAIKSMEDQNNFNCELKIYANA